MKNQMTDTTSGPGTVVGVNVALSGTLKDQNDIVVYGMVDGEVISEKSVTVGQTAQVKGPVHGQSITISGTIRGAIDASEKLEILETGKVYGSITTKDLVIHSGAVLVGKVIMGAEEELPAEEVATEEKPENSETESVEAAKEETTLAPDEE